MKFSFSITNNAATPKIKALILLAKNPEPILRAMGTTFKSITEGTFNSVGASYRPSPWPAKYGGDPSNLQSRNPVLSKSFQLTVTPSQATVSNPMIYAGVHQFGATITPKNAKFLSWVTGDGKRVFVKKVTIPARPFFPVDRSGNLTPAAEKLIVDAGVRMIAAEAAMTA